MNTESQTSIESLGPTSELAMLAWLGALHFAIGDDDALAKFRADTGNKWRPSRIPIERMIDEVTGAEREFILSFVRWFNRSIWGEVNGRACNGDEIESLEGDLP